MGIREAWRALFRSTPQRRMGNKVMPLAWPDFRLDRPHWQIYDYRTYVAEGFNLNTLIYGAIMYKARALSGVPLRAYTGDPDNPEPLPADAPLAQLCARPNPHMAWRTFQMLRVTYLNLSGNSFTMCDRPRGGGTPLGLYPLRPDRVFIIPRKESKGLLGYLYVPEGKAYSDGIPILPQDMMHTKLPNPGDELEGLGYGLSPISPLAYSADVDNMVTKFLKLFFQKGALPSGILKFTDALDDDMVSRIRERWSEVYGGYEAMASEIAVMDNAGEYQRVGFTFEELGFDGIDERNESRILGPFGVPPILIGTRVGLNRSTYANYQEARRACWEDTLIPEKDLFENEDAYYLQDEGGREFVQYDLSHVPALQQDKTVQVAAAYQMWQMGTPAALAYATVGLQVEEFDGSDLGFLPMGVQTVEDVTAPPAPTPPQLLPFTGQDNPPAEEEEPAAPEQDNEGAAEAEEESEEEEKAARKSFAPESKDLAWKRIDRIARAWEPDFSRAAQQALEFDRRHVLAILNSEGKSALRRKASVDLQRVGTLLGDYMARGSIENWRDEFTPVIAGVIEDQTQKWAVELGVEWNVRNLAAEEWFKSYVLQFAQPIDDTTKAWMDYLLQRAMREGWSIEQTSRAMETMFDVWMDPAAELTDEQAAWFGDRMPQYRREAIARTETIRASNEGSFEQFREWGVQKKEWLSTIDNRTRREDFDHAEPNGQVVGIDEDFDVSGEKLRFPGDPRGSPGNTINCRCTVLPVVE